MLSFRAMSLFKERVDSLPLEDQFRKVALLFQGAEYRMGSENMYKCDCSGLVCSTFTLLGFKLRINANDLMTKICDDSTKKYIRDKITLVFYVNEDGIAKHVGILYPNGELLHSSHPNGCQMEGVVEVNARYRKRGMKVVAKEVNWGKLETIKGTVWGLDEDLR